jgi:predicted dehydrogenase
MKQPLSRTASDSLDSNRRDFIKGSSAATLLALAGGATLIAPAARAEDKAEEPAIVPLKVGVIGCGIWGRDILNTLARLPRAEVAAVCDTYGAMVKRAKDAAPKAETTSDYTKILGNKDIPAVIVATPSHQHKEIVIAAIKAGKQVYCEAPIAHSIEDARAIAAAAKAAPFQYFQPGLNLRADPQRKFLHDFVRAGAAGKLVKARAQSHKKQSWRRTSPNPDREKELNWRLDSAVSPGLIGELCVHQIDNLTWLMNGRPNAVTGFSSIVHWNDGRDVADTVEAAFEFPGGARAYAEATLANSFDAEYEMLYGTDAAVMQRGNQAWMFKEVDAPMLGWEVYARKDMFYKETGIALVMGASKLPPKTEKDGEAPSPFVGTPLYYGLEAFIYNANVVNNAIKDFIDSFGDEDKKAMAEALQAAVMNNKPAPTWREGFEATVLALKANEAATKRTRLEIPESLFEV